MKIITCYAIAFLSVIQVTNSFGQDDKAQIKESIKDEYTSTLDKKSKDVLDASKESLNKKVSVKGADETSSKLEKLSKKGLCGQGGQCLYFNNMFLGPKKVLTLDVNNTLMMSPASSKVAEQMWGITKQANGYYRIYNAAKPGMCLDSNPSRPDVRPCGNYSGQFWKFTDQNGWLRISNMYQKTGRVLDTYNGVGNRVFFESKAKNTSGSHWKMTEGALADLKSISGRRLTK